MNIKEFYTFRSKLSFSTVQAHPVGLNEFHPIDPNKRYLYDEYRLIQGDYNNISFPVIFKQKYGKKLNDILDTGWVGLFLISSKLREVLEENTLTGWKTFDVKLLDKQDKEIQGYHGLSITGRCGMIDYSKSEIVVKRLVPNAPLGKYYKGLYVDLDKWDGSDFFLPGNYFGTIITSKVAEVMKKSKPTNIRLENLMEIETPYFALQNMT